MRTSLTILVCRMLLLHICLERFKYDVECYTSVSRVSSIIRSAAAIVALRSHCCLQASVERDVLIHVPSSLMRAQVVDRVAVECV